MKFIFYFLSFLCMTAPTFANDYSRVIEDLPLMTGMAEIADAAVQFDTIGGRVMETAAEVQSGQKQVYSFYANTLPQLGWTRIAGGYMAYQRAGEMLTIEAVPGSAPGKTRVQFRLGPNSNK